MAVEIREETAKKLEWLSSYLGMNIQETVRFCIDRIYDFAEIFESYDDCDDPAQLTLDNWLEGDSHE